MDYLKNNLITKWVIWQTIQLQNGLFDKQSNPTNGLFDKQSNWASDTSCQIHPTFLITNNRIPTIFCPKCRRGKQATIWTTSILGVYEEQRDIAEVKCTIHVTLHVILFQILQITLYSSFWLFNYQPSTDSGTYIRRTRVAEQR